MNATIQDNAHIRFVIQWAEKQPSVRAVLLTSSRVNPDAPQDIFSDYDVILVVTEVYPFFNDRNWLGDFGPVLVVYRDPLRRYFGDEKFAYITQYENGLKIDFTLWSIEIMRRVAADPALPVDLDIGYAVLLDKDGLTTNLKPPTYKAFIPAPPSEITFHTVVEELFHEATYVAKHLWRDDLIAAKYNLDYAMKFDNLRQMLEWHMEIDHHWAVKPGAYGRGLKKRVRSEIWAQLEDTYCGADLEANWTALFKTIDLFRKVALEVANHLGYLYPHDLDRRAVAYLEKVRRLDRQASSFSPEFSEK